MKTQLLAKVIKCEKERKTNERTGESKMEFRVYYEKPTAVIRADGTPEIVLSEGRSWSDVEVKPGQQTMDVSVGAYVEGRKAIPFFRILKVVTNK